MLLWCYFKLFSVKYMVVVSVIFFAGPLIFSFLMCCLGLLAFCWLSSSCAVSNCEFIYHSLSHAFELSEITVFFHLYPLLFNLLCIQDCGSYFTAVLYVEHWCEEHFGSLTLGSPDFSHHETVCLRNLSIYYVGEMIAHISLLRHTI